MKFVKRVHFKIVFLFLKNKTGRYGRIGPGARSVLAVGPGERRPGRSPRPRSRGAQAQARAGGGRRYLSQSLCSVLYTSSSRLKPSKKGMRSSSSVSVMSSNQDCTGTAFSGWKM